MKVIRRNAQHHRSGMTIVEFVVVLVLVLFLLALVAPALQKAHSPRRKLHCLNNARNVGLAMQAFSTSTEGQLPYLTYELPIPSQNNLGPSGTMNAGWPIAILPALDATAVLKNIKKNAVATSTDNEGTVFTIAESERIWIPTFTCPQDQDSDHKPGGLSYVVNTGFISRSLYYGDPDGLHRLGLMSWNGNDIPDEDEDVQVQAATGVMWRPHELLQPSLDTIAAGDGQSQTILLTENIQAGLWYDTDTARISFGLPVATKNGRVPFGEGNVFQSTENPLNTEFPGGTLATSSPQDWRINSDRKAATGTRPRPSSNHDGFVNVIMCDGRGIILNNDIDPHVYVKLITSNGVAHGEGKLDSRGF